MKQKFVSVATAILISLGIAGCSSGSDNGKSNMQEVGVSSDTQKNQVTVNNQESENRADYTTTTTASPEAIAKAKAEEARKESELARKAAEEAAKVEAARLAEEERLRKLAEDEQARLAEEAAKAKADQVANSLLSAFANQAESASFSYLNDQAQKETLLATLENDTSACKKVTGTRCVSNAVKGDVLLSDMQSYSGYAVIREEASADKSTPVNSYVAVVTTPTTEKAMVVDATYKGTAVYTAKNVNPYAGYTRNGYNTELTLNVKDSVVSGDIKSTTGKKPTIVTFNDAQIQVGHQAVVFEGKAVFNTAAPLSLSATDSDGNKLTTIEGSYKGQFAGAQAEEVVGTFETDSTVKEVSVQGAFMGKKVE